MNSFTASQIACLQGIELPLWRLNDARRPSVQAEPEKGAEPSDIPSQTLASPAIADPTGTLPNTVREGADEKGPLADEIRRLLAWCQTAGQWPAPVHWQINSALSQSSFEDNLLQTPEPAQLMQSAALKRALWQLLGQRSN